MVPQFTGAAYFGACEPLAEAAGRVDRPLGDLRRDAKLVAQLTVGQEPEARNEHPSQRGGEAVVDADVGREPRIHPVRSRLEVQDRESASADRAENLTGLLPLGENNAPSRLATEHASHPLGSVVILAIQTRSTAADTSGENASRGPRTEDQGLAATPLALVARASRALTAARRPSRSPHRLTSLSMRDRPRGEFGERFDVNDLLFSSDRTKRGPCERGSKKEGQAMPHH